MQRKLELWVILLLAATFLVPLIMIPSKFIFPFIVPKILIFRGLVLVMIALFIPLCVVRWREYLYTWKQPVSGAVLLLLLSLGISTFVGEDWYRSFWDNHERMLGLFTIAHYIAAFFIATAVLKDRDWFRLFRVFLTAGGIVMIVGLMQKIDPQLLLNQGATRVTSTLGNTIYVGGYGLFLLFVGYWLWIKESNTWWRLHAAIGGFLGFCGILISGTRGAMLGLGAGGFVLLLCYGIALKNAPKIRRTIFAVLGAGVIAVGLLFAFRQTNFVQSIPAVGRLVSTSIHEGTASTRLKAWGIAIDAWKDRPLFGWGPNNYYYAFNQYYKAEFLRHGWKETWFDNAHNIIMNTLATQGIFGLIVYLGIFATSIVMLVHARRKNGLDVHTTCVGISFLVAHLIQNAFVFENPTSYLYFFFFLAWINKITIPAPAVQIKEKIAQPSSGLVVALSLIALLFIYSFNINPGRANVATFRTIQKMYQLGSDIPQTYQETVAIPTPHVDDIRTDVARIMGLSAASYIDRGQRDYVKQLLELGYTELEKNRTLHPKDIRIHIQQAQLAQAYAQYFKDVTYLQRAETILEEALSFSPERQQVQFLLSFVKLSLGKGGEAIQVVQDAVDNDPAIGESWWRLAALYEQTGQIELAKQAIEDAHARGIGFIDEGKVVVDRILAR